MGKGNNMFSFKDYLNVDYTQTGNPFLALASKKRKSQLEDSDKNTDEVEEALTMQQRMKMKTTFRKNKAKIKLGRLRASKKFATPEKLQRRAEKKARDILTKRITKGKRKADLSYGQRTNVEKQLAKRKGAIKKIARKLLPFIRKKDRNKFKDTPVPTSSATSATSATSAKPVGIGG